MKTAVRPATRTVPAASSTRGKARARTAPEERSIVTLELRAIEDLNKLTARLLAVADLRTRAPKKGHASRDDFSALVAHELPLMERQLEQMARILDDLAVVSNLSEGKLSLSRMRVRLADVVAASLEYARPALTEGGHEVAVRMPTKGVHLHADAARLAQAVGTLLIHSARRAAHEDLLSILATVDGAEVVLTVRDNAVAGTRAVGSMFGLFPAVEADASAGASGLCIGLALVKGLVGLHGGSVMVECAGPGRPTTFEIRLPILPD